MNKRLTPAEQLQLKIRVKKAKESIRKGNFFDDVYGKMSYQEHSRIDNFWRLNLVSEEFTIKIENYANQ